jgi:hypothetical protein
VQSALQLLKETFVKKNYVQYLVVLSTLALLFPLAAVARGNARSVVISDLVQIGTTQLKPGNYKVEWEGTGAVVQVSFLQNGKTVVTVPGTLKANDDQVTQDAVVIQRTNASTPTLEEVDFGHQKVALVFDQTAGM